MELAEKAPRMVLDEVKGLLPQVFIDYLWSLVEQEGAGFHTFFLTPKRMAGQFVQEIIHYPPSGKGGIVHRIFGIDPVTCTVCVTPYEDGCHMSLSGPLEAAAMMGA